MSYTYSNSIYAQRSVERFFITPDPSVANKKDMVYTAQPMVATAHADVQGTLGGLRSSYDGAAAFAAQAKERRDELLAKYANNESSS